MDGRQWNARMREAAGIVGRDLNSLRWYLPALVVGTVGGFTLTREQRERMRLIRRYVGHGGRYLHLRGGVLAWPRSRQWLFQYRLRRSARRASTSDLVRLLDHGGWRERLAAAWLIAAGCRSDLRERLAQDLLAEDPKPNLWHYCTALACLGTEEDADLLCRYLDRALLLPQRKGESSDNQYQEAAMGALLYLDGVLGTDRARPFVAPDGPWERWSSDADTDSLTALHQYTAQMVAFAEGRDPGIRAQRPNV